MLICDSPKIYIIYFNLSKICANTLYLIFDLNSISYVFSLQLRT